MATLSQNINQAISDFAAIKTSIQNKGVSVPSGTPTSQYSSCVNSIPIGDMGALIDGSVTHATIPAGTTTLRDYTFYFCQNLSTVSIPAGLTRIGTYCFQNCSSLTSVTIPDSVTFIGQNAFCNCTSISNLTLPSSLIQLRREVFESCSALTTLTIPSGYQSIEYAAFQYCTGLQSVSLPNSLLSLASDAFGGCTHLTTINIPASINVIYAATFRNCTSLENVTLGSGFSADNLNLSYSTQYTAATIVSWLNALNDRTGLSARTLTIGATNLAKLTAEEIAIATNKNWNLA